MAIDGKASRRSKMTGKQALHLVSAFAAGARLVLGQEACAEKSNDLTAIPVLLDPFGKESLKKNDVDPS